MYTQDQERDQKGELPSSVENTETILGTPLFGKNVAGGGLSTMGAPWGQC